MASHSSVEITQPKIRSVGLLAATKTTKPVQHDEVNCWLHLASTEGLETPFPPSIYLKIFQKKKPNSFGVLYFSKNQQTVSQTPPEWGVF